MDGRSKGDSEHQTTSTGGLALEPVFHDRFSHESWGDSKVDFWQYDREGPLPAHTPLLTASGRIRSK